MNIEYLIHTRSDKAVDWTEHSIKGRKGIHDQTKLWIGQNTLSKEGREYMIRQSCGLDRTLN